MPQISGVRPPFSDRISLKTHPVVNPQAHHLHAESVPIVLVSLPRLISKISDMHLHTFRIALLAASVLLSTGCEEETVDDTVVIDTQAGSGVTDISGNSYATIVLGNGQEWMAENLRTVRYANGDSIPQAPTGWQALSTGAYCWHESNVENAPEMGLLYNWYAVADARNVCPDGWHVPTNVDWNALAKFLDANAVDTLNPQSTVAGGYMKATGTDVWQSPNTDAGNQSLFAALPSGHRAPDGVFQSYGQFGYWWSANQNTGTVAWNRYVYYGNGALGRYLFNKRAGLAVRCVKD
jgi:uncharacterized protein (TIGR02145 family)